MSTTETKTVPTSVSSSSSTTTSSSSSSSSTSSNYSNGLWNGHADGIDRAWASLHSDDQTATARCSSCNGNIVEDHRQGDMICEDCGLVSQERMIEEESEVRIFNDDPDSAQKIRTGPATNINIDSILGSGKQKNVREDKEFLYEGFKLINQVLESCYSGGSVHADLRCRAHELFQQAFYQQVHEKRNGRETNNGQRSNRQRFSKKKQLVYASIILAFQKTNAAGPKKRAGACLFFYIYISSVLLHSHIQFHHQLLSLIS
eukprot:TRINITY_DN5763_c0_g5_i2.p1 TRINITY_DN5763_c0_g5~~TRINITY_DN5763_c0_g5_i2.p1  ORF type:complete len:260 (-),score=59.91 TRINITY_DN5763_c0_g5_i2:5-784(-)